MEARRWFPPGWFDLCKAPRKNDVVLIAVAGRNGGYVTPARWIPSDHPAAQVKNKRELVARYDGYWASPRDAAKPIGHKALAWRPMPAFDFETFEARAKAERTEISNISGAHHEEA